MSRSLPIVLAIAILSLAVAAPAHAYLITVNFTVTGAGTVEDPVYGDVSADGSFSFDSSIIPPGGGNSNSQPTGLNFSWTGTDWTDANTLFGSDFFPALTFDAGGNLTSWTLFGGPNGYAFSLDANDPDDFYIIVQNSYRDFTYRDQGSKSHSSSSVTWSTTTADAPAPGALALFAPGLLALGLIRRRKS